MRKKIVCLGIALLMLFPLAGLSGCENEWRLRYPSVIRDFSLEDYTEKFFEKNTLILVPFEHGSLLDEYLNFYTAYAEDGKLNFLVENTYPYDFGSGALDIRVFAVTVRNEVLDEYELGELIEFDKYDFIYDSETHVTNRVENPREWLKDIEEKSIEHKVSYVLSGSEERFVDARQQFKGWNGERKITTITSVEELSVFFTLDA